MTKKIAHELNCDGPELPPRARMERPWSCTCGWKTFGYDRDVKKAHVEHKREVGK